jgi:hypothetical protein
MASSGHTSVFRPCIDLHDGLVKQIVGSSLSDSTPGDLKTNFVATSVSPEWEGGGSIILNGNLSVSASDY